MSQTIKILSPFVSFIVFVFFSNRKESVWINIVFWHFIETRHNKRHHMSCDDDEGNREKERTDHCI